MSECKHSFNLNEGKFCKYCGINFDDLMRNIDVSNLEKERDELQAHVAVLRGALERARKGFVNLIDLNLLPSEEYEKDANKIAQCCFEALSDTSTEAAERVNALVEALESIVKEDKNETTFEENFSNALAIAKPALAEWRK